jgi:hypothetical protein
VRGNGHFSPEAAIGAGLLGPGGELELLEHCEVTPRATSRDSVRATMAPCSSSPTRVLMSGPAVVMVRLGPGHVGPRRPPRRADRRPRRAAVLQRRPRKWAAGADLRGTPSRRSRTTFALSSDRRGVAPHEVHRGTTASELGTG